MFTRRDPLGERVTHTDCVQDRATRDQKTLAIMTSVGFFAVLVALPLAALWLVVAITDLDNVVIASGFYPIVLLAAVIAAVHLKRSTRAC